MLACLIYLSLIITSYLGDVIVAGKRNAQNSHKRPEQSANQKKKKQTTNNKEEQQQQQHNNNTKRILDSIHTTKATFRRHTTEQCIARQASSIVPTTRPSNTHTHTRKHTYIISNETRQQRLLGPALTFSRALMPVDSTPTVFWKKIIFKNYKSEWNRQTIRHITKKRRFYRASKMHRVDRCRRILRSELFLAVHELVLTNPDLVSSDKRWLRQRFIHTHTPSQEPSNRRALRDLIRFSVERTSTKHNAK